ncbi:hypothetical protein [Acetobacterium tundrae]|uniref:Uncharacterized protein n=1 Tax=Acetobacterium tundrae TaxID=132932 RepID=A0ABR6WQB0_9FIRM|nr:hypothetical protein [Acetobacterium tundrae]MBC3798544.1 hypothetical protein [Acetobacterium tundrae]
MVIKKFVPVIARFEEDGIITPQKVIWENGRVFEIDQVLDMRPGVSLKAGGQGMRYLCRIMKKDVYIYYEEPKWFVESKER